MLGLKSVIRDMLSNLFAVGICLILLAFFRQLLFGNKGIGARFDSDLASMFKGAGSRKGERAYRKMAEENKASATQLRLRLHFAAARGVGVMQCVRLDVRTERRTVD